MLQGLKSAESSSDAAKYGDEMARQRWSPASALKRIETPPGASRLATWSLTSLQQRLVKTGGRLIKHARYYWLLLAESHLTRRLFGGMVRRIDALPVPAG